MKLFRSPFFSHLGWVPVVILAVQILVWSVDRKPPHVFGAYSVSHAESGRKVIVTINVKRNLTRDCSVSVMRQFHDAEGVRFSIGGGTQNYNLQTLIDSEKRTPGKMVLGFELPIGAAKGPGALVSTADYVCNPVHLVWPIHLVIFQDIEVH